MNAGNSTSQNRLSRPCRRPPLPTAAPPTLGAFSSSRIVEQSVLRVRVISRTCSGAISHGSPFHGYTRPQRMQERRGDFVRGRKKRAQISSETVGKPKCRGFSGQMTIHGFKYTNARIKQCLAHKMVPFAENFFVLPRKPSEVTPLMTQKSHTRGCHRKRVVLHTAGGVALVAYSTHRSPICLPCIPAWGIRP